MKVAIITDTHHGFKNDCNIFQDYFKTFYDDIFFPELRKRNVSTILHAGDLYDNRQRLGLQNIHRVRKEIIEKLDSYTVHLILGNHDVFFKDSNEIDSVTELCGHRRNFHIYRDGQDVRIGNLLMFMSPWINPSNLDDTIKKIERTSAKVCLGHLELNGFKMDRVSESKHGLEAALFNRFSHVLTGHFHEPSIKGNIRYLGAPYDFTHLDCGINRGFHIFDTDTLELEHIGNPDRMFYRLGYDDRDQSKHHLIENMNLSRYEKRYVKVVVKHKTSPYLFEKWLASLRDINTAKLTVDEEFNVEATTRVLIESEKKQTDEDDTLTFLNQYVDTMNISIDTEKLKEMVRDEYLKALKTEKVI